MSYTVQLSPAAHKSFALLEASVRERIAPKMDALSANPRPPGSKKLKGGSELYRIRVGDYRVLYRIEDARLVVLVVSVGNRRDVYR